MPENTFLGLAPSDIVQQTPILSLTCRNLPHSSRQVTIFLSDDQKCLPLVCGGLKNQPMRLLSLEYQCIFPVSGVSNGPIQFKSARKIWPLLELLAEITRVLACVVCKISESPRMLGISLKCARLLEILVLFDLQS